MPCWSDRFVKDTFTPFQYDLGPLLVTLRLRDRGPWLLFDDLGSGCYVTSYGNVGLCRALLPPCFFFAHLLSWGLPWLAC